MPRSIFKNVIQRWCNYVMGGETPLCKIWCNQHGVDTAPWRYDFHLCYCNCLNGWSVSCLDAYETKNLKYIAQLLTSIGSEIRMDLQAVNWEKCCLFHNISSPWIWNGVSLFLQTHPVIQEFDMHIHIIYIYVVSVLTSVIYVNVI